MVVETPHDLAHGLNQRLSLGLTPRPWNIHSPDETFYRLVPGRNNRTWPRHEDDEPGPPDRALRGVEDATTFAELVSRLQIIGDYHWVDVNIGTFVKRGEVDLLGLHEPVLSHSSGWLK
jgi:hypothetical protein